MVAVGKQPLAAVPPSVAGVAAIDQIAEDAAPGGKKIAVNIQIAVAQVAAPHDSPLPQQFGQISHQLLVLGAVYAAFHRPQLLPRHFQRHGGMEQRPFAAGVKMQRLPLPPQLDQAALGKQHLFKAGVG